MSAYVTSAMFTLAVIFAIIGICNAIRDCGRYIAKAILEAERAREEFAKAHKWSDK